MNIKLHRIVWVLLVLCGFTKITEMSIVGVTYRDHFDFEQRYANPHECDPFYWHPLHLPEHCAAKFERMIRTQLHSRAKIQREDEMESIINTFKTHMARQRKQHSKKQSYYFDSSDEGEAPNESIEISSFPFEPTPNENGDIYSAEIEFPASTIVQRRPWPPQPYDRMLNLMRQEVMMDPPTPFIGLVPYIGLSTIYRQPISQQTEDVIMKTAKVYANMAEDAGIVWKPGVNLERKESNKTAEDGIGLPENEDIKNELREIKEFILQKKMEMRPVADVDPTDFHTST